MIRYILGRVAQAIFSIFFITTLVFLLVRLTGDPSQILAPEFATSTVEDKIKVELGLDKPLYEQYAKYMGGLLTFNLGTSFRGPPVSPVLLDHLPATATLALAAIVVAIVVAVPLGVLSALRRGSKIDALARGIALFGQSVPGFWLAIMGILVFAVLLRWVPVAGRTGPSSYILPALVLGLAPVAGIVRLLRSSMLEVQESDFVRMARAKGLPEGVVVRRHELRNAIIPVLTFAGLLVGGLMNGSVVVENVFAWPGIGKMTLDAVESRDFPVVQGTVIMSAIFLILANLVVDILYVLVDPRIRFKE
jgi:peptide/nickel transport system permease protein